MFPLPEHYGYQSELLNAACMTDLLSDKRSIISAVVVSGSDPLPYMLPSTQLQSATSSVGPCVASEPASKELPPQSVSSVAFPLHITHCLLLLVYIPWVKMLCICQNCKPI